MNLITANQVTDRCGRLSYLSSKPEAAGVLQVVRNTGRYKGSTGGDCQPMACARVSGSLTIREVPSFTVARHITKEEWDQVGLQLPNHFFPRAGWSAFVSSTLRTG